MDDDDSFFWVEEYTAGNKSDFLPHEDGNGTPFRLNRKRKGRANRMEFVGWGSKPLITFLNSIGVDTSKQISQFDVASIINRYTSDHNLHHPSKKKRIQCDEALLSLFGRKTISRIKIHELLEAHFAQNLLESDDDFFFSSEEEEDGVVGELQNERKTPQAKKRAVESPPKSCFAAVVPDNIKLVYLKRSLVIDLAKNPETFDGKVLGCFVRIKSDPNDFSQKNSHMLVQVTGIKKAPETNDKSAVVILQVSNFIKDVAFSMLSDENFKEEECEDLRKRVMDGLLKRPTIMELEEKARVLHEDITKHWLLGELALLQKLIDRANEKGWRKELFEYLERRHLLQNPDEQSRLLREVPKVTADETDLDIEDTAQASPDKPSSPKSTLGALPEANGDQSVPMASEAVNETQKQSQALDTFSEYNWEVQTVKVKGKKRSRAAKKLQVIDLSDDETEDQASSAPSFQYDVGSVIWHYADPQQNTQGPFSVMSLKRWHEANYFPSDFKVWMAGQTQKEAVLLTDILGHLFPH